MFFKPFQDLDEKEDFLDNVRASHFTVTDFELRDGYQVSVVEAGFEILAKAAQEYRLGMPLNVEGYEDAVSFEELPI